MEPLVARKAAAAVRAGTPATVLTDALAAAGAALADGELDTFHTASGGVHAAIETLAANTLFTDVMEPLRERSNRLNVANIDRDPAVRHHEHVGLVNAIAAGDSELAAAVAFAHVEWGRARTLETLSSVPGYNPDA